VPDGQSLIIGGMIQQSQTNSDNSVPLLSKIPIINFFFSQNKKEKNVKEIVFFILPKIFHHNYEFDKSSIISGNNLIHKKK
jgi:type II secretory pathway component GspD/PulD (secretin)